MMVQGNGAAIENILTAQEKGEDGRKGRKQNAKPLLKQSKRRAHLSPSLRAKRRLALPDHPSCGKPPRSGRISRDASRQRKEPRAHTATKRTQEPTGQPQRKVDRLSETEASTCCARTQPAPRQKEKSESAAARPGERRLSRHRASLAASFEVTGRRELIKASDAEREHGTRKNMHAGVYHGHPPSERITGGGLLNP
jgi:hypothetical protein